MLLLINSINDMKKLLKNLIAVFLFVGVLASCESTDPLINEAKKSMVLQNFDEAIALLDQSIEKNPESGVPYYYKAMVYSDKAVQIQDPDERKPLYHDFRENIDTARVKFAAQEDKPAEADQVDNLVISVWGLEHNTAIQYATNDSIMQSVDEPLAVAASHLQNAIIVNPDSALSYEVLGQVYSANGQPQEALQAQRKAMSLRDSSSSDDYVRLADYYRGAGRVDSAITTLNEGLTMYPDSVILTQKLADAYMENEMRDSSIAVVEKLIEIDPENMQYRLALGTRLLQATDNLTASIASNYDEIFSLNSSLRGASRAERDNIEAKIQQLEEENTRLQNEIDELSNYAEQELLKVVDKVEDSANAYNALAILYQNRAAALFQLRNNTDDLNKSQEYDTQAKEALQQSMKYYEVLVELEPDNQSAWSQLSNIYYTLDMQEKAKEALEKAGN